jgi:hypothetical protein
LTNRLLNIYDYLVDNYFFCCNSSGNVDTHQVDPGSKGFEYYSARPGSPGRNKLLAYRIANRYSAFLTNIPIALNRN